MTHTIRASGSVVATRRSAASARRRAAAVGLAVAAIAGGTALLLSGGTTGATPPMARADGAPVVVELFTSQSCYSCPPAEAILAELARRDGIVALEHHVDYWDSLVYGSAGRWKDVFSRPEATERQRAYNAVVEGRGHSYTPQMVIDGRYEVVGSRDREVRRAIDGARRSDEPRLAVAAGVAGGKDLRVAVSGIAVPANGGAVGIWLVRYLREHTTEVTRGENHGKTLSGRNVVLDMRRIGEWRGGDVVIDVAGAKPDDEQGCAVLVQSDTPGPVLGAAYCTLDKAADS